MLRAWWCAIACNAPLRCSAGSPCARRNELSVSESAGEQQHASAASVIRMRNMFAARRQKLFCRDDLLPLLSEVFDTERDNVTRLQEHRNRLHSERNTRRRAGDDDVARFHDEKLRAIPDRMFAAEDHRTRVAALTALAIHVEPHAQVLRILDFVLGDEPRSDRAERLAPFALVPLPARTLDLEDAFRHVVRQ